MWMTQNESSKFWLSVLTELQNRGVKDIFIACVDGLTGISRSHRSGVSPSPGATVHCPSGQELSELRLLQRPQGGGGRLAVDLHGRHRSGGRASPGRVCPNLGLQIPHYQQVLAHSLEPSHPVLSVSIRDSAGYLHHQCHRVHEYDPAKSPQTPSSFSHR